MCASVTGVRCGCVHTLVTHPVVIAGCIGESELGYNGPAYYQAANNARLCMYRAHSDSSVQNTCCHCKRCCTVRRGHRSQSKPFVDTVVHSLPLFHWLDNTFRQEHTKAHISLAWRRPPGVPWPHCNQHSYNHQQPLMHQINLV